MFTCRRMNGFVTLVDFDGVVLRNAACKRHIHKKVSEYVHHKIPAASKGIIPSINAEFYQAFGHTNVGLRRYGLSSSISEFNGYVYGSIPRSLSFTKEEAKDWQEFYSFMNECGIPIYVFSNAPKEWCMHFIDANKYKVQYVQDSMPFSKHPILCEETVKPCKMAFDLLKMKLTQKQVIFLDDKMINFKHTMNDTRWTNVWIHEDAKSTHQLWNGMWVSDSYVKCMKDMKLDI